MVHAGNTFALVWESKQLIEISNALMKMLARSAGQNAVQLGLYATVQSAHCLVAGPLCTLPGFSSSAEAVSTNHCAAV